MPDTIKHGIAVGKFYPPHAGHHYLINEALKECDKLTVAVCYSSVENISPKDRVAWLKDAHPSDRIRFVGIHDDTPVLYTDETWDFFLEALMDGLDYLNNDAYALPEGAAWGYPNIIYSGEAYAVEFGERLLARYDQRVFREYFPERIEVEILDRSIIGTSASNFRDDPINHWEQLAPATKAGLCKRVVVCGGESTGTTTLAKELADHYETTCVPEYGRHFDWAVGKHHEWKPDDFVHIAEMQKLWEDKLARESHFGLLICDTDEFATEMFSHIYLGESNPKVIEQAQATPADIYIVTSDVEVEFEDDGTRFNSGKREWSTEWLRANLPGHQITVVGSKAERLYRAVGFIDYLLTWDIEPPLEYRT